MQERAAGLEELERMSPILGRLDALLAAAQPSVGAARRAVVDRWRADGDALRFHLRDSGGPRKLVAVIGGTGTGKSTLVNRLFGRTLTAASFRRTFTSGPVAIVRLAADLPRGWTGLEPVVVAPDELPARGRPGSLLVVETGAVAVAGADPVVAGPVTSEPHAPDAAVAIDLPVIVDTPDLDGDQPAHHAQADRAFRWAQGLLFLVTPEKYQMTELLPYYRLARRYGVPALYVMNKCEEQAVAEDYRAQLDAAAAAGGDAGPAAVYVIPRDDAAYEPPAAMGIAALRAALASLSAPPPRRRAAGLQMRAADLLGRFSDQLIAPLREDRKAADELITSLRAMETPAAGVDVNPLT